jgi:hypothetical protein
MASFRNPHQPLSCCRVYVLGLRVEKKVSEKVQCYCCLLRDTRSLTLQHPARRFVYRTNFPNCCLLLQLVHDDDDDDNNNDDG